MNNKFERVPKSEYKKARSFAHELINLVRTKAKNKGIFKNHKNKCRFTNRLVGSAKINTVLKDKTGKYDIDYQLNLGKKFLSIEDDSSEIKEFFFGIFSSFRNKEINKITINKVENSTTAITIKTNDFSIDYVIIRESDDNEYTEIIKRNNSRENESKNSYTWCKLEQRKQINGQDVYKYFKKMDPIKRRDFINEIYLPAKKRLKDSDSKEKTSYELFYELLHNFHEGGEKVCQD